MIMNFYDVESTPMFYTVIGEKCAFYNETDVSTMVGYLPVHTIYEVVEFFGIEINGMHWAKIKMHDGEYYAVISQDKCVIEVAPTSQKDNFITRFINKIKSIFKNIKK